MNARCVFAAATASLALVAAPLVAQGVCTGNPPLRIEKGVYGVNGFQLTSAEMDLWLTNVRAMCSAQPWTVSRGGTGVATLTAYAPIFGGTTATGAVQSGTVGTTGQVLTSNGAGALPTFQAAAGGADDQTAAEVAVADVGEYYVGTEVEVMGQEIGASLLTKHDNASADARYIMRTLNPGSGVSYRVATGSSSTQVDAYDFGSFEVATAGDGSTGTPTAQLVVVGDILGVVSGVAVNAGTLTFNGTDVAVTTDPRFTDARTPVAHQATHQQGGTDALGGTLAAAITGNAGTATALAANGANCSAGNYPLGVDASGAAESCTAAGGLSGLGATDNVIPRTVGTGGATLEGTAVTIGDDSSITTAGHIVLNGSQNYYTLGVGDSWRFGASNLSGNSGGHDYMTRDKATGYVNYITAGNGSDQGIVFGSTQSGPVLEILTATRVAFVNVALQLKPLASPPFTCAAGTEGAMYQDISHATCVCDGTTWNVLTGSGVGACS